MTLTVDEVLEQIGSMGHYQIRAILIVGWFAFWLTFHPLLSVFTAAEPKWSCVQNNTFCNLTGSFQLGDELYSARCSMPRESWEFDKSFTSVITEWDVVCSRSFLGTLSSSIYFAGMFVGVMLFGVISDKFGRKPTLFITTFLASTSGVICAFSPNFPFYCGFKTLVGLTAGGAVAIYFLIGSEITGVKHRGTSGTATWFFWIFSIMALPLFAYFLRDWRTLTVVTSALGFTCMPLWWWVPETPRWLLVNNKNEQLVKMLTNVAQVNNKEMPKGEIGLPVKKNVKQGNFFDLFRTKKLTMEILIQWLAWFVISMVYYGVSMSAGNLSGNIYLVFFLMSLVELPANAMSIWIMNRFGRKKTTVVTIIAAALGSIFAAAIPYEDDMGYVVGRIIMGLIAKFMIVIAFAVIYVFTTELMPTVIRNVGLGSCSSSARIGSFAGPILPWLRNVHFMLPFGIMGLAALLTGILCLTLPETLNTPTREVVDADATTSNTDVSLSSLQKNDPVQYDPKQKEFLGELYTNSI